MKQHDLKLNITDFLAVWERKQTAQYRKNDRDYKAGDLVVLRPYITDKKEYLNNHTAIRAQITNIIHSPSFGIPKGYCVCSIDLLVLEP